MASGQIDFEAAWHELSETLLTRDGWGTKTLAAHMADIAVRNRVPEGPLERVFRMNRGRLARLIASHINTEAPPSVLAGTTPGEGVEVPDDQKTEEVADDARDHHTPAAR